MIKCPFAEFISIIEEYRRAINECKLTEHSRNVISCSGNFSSCQLDLDDGTG